MTFVKYRYTISEEVKNKLNSMTPKFGYNGFGEVVYFRTYSRQYDGRQEQWKDTVIRNVEGILSIYYNWFKTHRLPIDMEELDNMADRLAVSMFNMDWLPPGRGLYAMGTEHVYNKGSAALNNCSYVEVKDLVKDLGWSMDMLMMGVGCGYGVYERNKTQLKKPVPKKLANSDGFIVNVVNYSLNGDLCTLGDRKIKVDKCPVGFTLQDTEFGQSTTIKAFNNINRTKHNAWIDVYYINDKVYNTYIVPDNREGWVESVEYLIRSFIEGDYVLDFNYDMIRPEGSKLGGFGGEASGADPLIKLHNRIRVICGNYINGHIGWVRLVADIANSIGSCVVAGNIRRSAQIILGDPDSEEFLNLKNYSEISDLVHYEGSVYKCIEFHISNSENCPGDSSYWEKVVDIDISSNSDSISIDDKKYLLLPWTDDTSYYGRESIGWMSNNSLTFSKNKDFKALSKVAETVQINGDPGIYNLINVSKYGRYGENKPDTATGCNPCGEIPLESYELCNLAEVFPTRCETEDRFYEAVKMATFYCTTVSLLPTHREETNAVINRNHRIGVSLSGIADWIDTASVHERIPIIRKGYKIVQDTNEEFAKRAGISPSIRTTTIKPSGSISKLPGVSAGMHFPTFKYAIRRIRISMIDSLVPVLMEAGVPWEIDKYSDSTYVFEFPIDQGKTRPAVDVSAWEQFALLSTLQREWSNNMVSCTVYFDPMSEGPQIENMISQFVPVIKSVSLLPHTPEGTYPQMPEEGITKEEYEKRVSEIGNIDWTRFGGSDGMDSRYCNNDTCTI